MGFIIGDRHSSSTTTTAEGFASCTETLGCESSDDLSDCSFSASLPLSVTKVEEEPYWMEKRWLRHRAAFPPPLTSLNGLCQRNFILCPVRTDGRLEIREVKIDRPEVLCTSRENGRLTMTLHTVPDDQLHDDNNDEEEEVNHQEFEIVDEHDEEVVETKVMETLEMGKMKASDVDEGELHKGIDIEEEIVQVNGGGGGGDVSPSGLPECWRTTTTTTLPVSPGGGGGNSEGMRRCSEDLNVHRHRRLPHQLHVWTTPHCVTTG